jgi:AcrR family transcriptional regulator
LKESHFLCFLNAFKIALDRSVALLYYLNMFKQEIARGRSRETRASILGHAIGRFREKGFDSTTMRDVAEAAGVAMGAAYYYFPSKEAIVQAYYDQVQSEHATRVAAALTERKLDLEHRLRIAFHTKFDILAKDRKLLGALFRYSGDPHHPLSVFGPGSGPIRSASMNVFAAAVGDEKLPNDIRELLPAALWAAHMGILLYFIYDPSPDQARTRKLIDGVTRLVVRVLGVAKMAIMKPLRGSLISLVRETELLTVMNANLAAGNDDPS